MDPTCILQAAAPRLELISASAEAGCSEVQEFYRDAVIFITGGTGFLGKQLIEKLFRSCKIKRLYLLLRSKKGHDIQQRMAEMFQDPVFGPLRDAQPEFEERISSVEGDIGQLRLGLSDNDWKTLVDEVNIIFHVAATVRFDEPLQNAVMLNVRGTREALRLGRACTRLRSFVHVSTAFAFATKDKIGKSVLDDFHSPPLHPELLIAMAEQMDKDAMDNITSSLLSRWSNTYTFTKAAAEEIVRSFGEQMPVCVVRPSVVNGAYSEPLPGWIDKSCVFGASGLILGLLVGVLHTVLAGSNMALDVIPVDFVNNLIIAAGWETGRGTHTQPRVYYITSTRKGICWKAVTRCLKGEGRGYISPKTTAYCFAYTTRYKNMYRFYSLVFHFIPALIIDGVSFLFGKKSGFTKLYKKVYKMGIVLSYFTTNGWIFEDGNTVELKNKMSKTDRSIFNFEVTDIDVTEFILLWVIGVRKFIIKDELKGTKEAVRKQKLYYFINCLFVCVLLFIFFIFLRYFF